METLGPAIVGLFYSGNKKSHYRLHIARILYHNSAHGIFR